jgi:hypothetical protein
MSMQLAIVGILIVLAARLNDSGINPMKFPIEVEPAPIKTIATSLWSCVKYGVIVFVIVWAIMRLFGM